MPPVWEIKEVRFYTDTACSRELPCTNVIGPVGSYPIISDYDTIRSLKSMGPSALEAADVICDRNSETGLTLSAGGWVGIDLRTRPETVRCVEIEQQTGLLHSVLELQVWSGTSWISPYQANIFDVPLLLDGLGVGKMKRPAPPFSTWRLGNLDVIRTWKVHELEFFTDCSSRVGCGSTNTALNGNVIASGSHTESSDGVSVRLFKEFQAFDKDLTTDWKAQCSPCAPMEAWIGLQLAGTVKVGCIRINQSGLARERSSSVQLEVWDGERWRKRAVYHDLGGDSWHYRPRAPNTMWRVVHESSVVRLKWDGVTCRRNDKETCESDHKRTLGHIRAWGVAELQFFHDDYCSGESPMVGRPIVSGSLRGIRGAHIPENAVDGVKQPLGRAWAPSCGVEDQYFGRWAALDETRIGFWHFNETLKQMLKLPATNASSCDKANDHLVHGDMCAGEWIGLDFHPEPKEVRCVKIVQSRNDHTQCCDPADNVRLERWNGSHWVVAWWLHQPTDVSVPVSYVSSKFSHLGRCPDLGREKELVQYVELRSRKLADTCEVPLPGSVQMLASPQCGVHPMCKRIFRDTGECCPVKNTHLNRCCCSYLYNSDVVFEDESEGKDRIDVEFIVISYTNVFPFISLWVAILHWWMLSSYFNPETHLTRLKMKVYAFRALEGPSLIKCYFRWALIERDSGKNRWYCARIFLHFSICFCVGGASLAIFAGLFVGLGIIWIMVQATMIVKLGKSRFDMRSRRHRTMRLAIVMSNIRNPEDLETFGRYGMATCKALFMGLAYFGKFVVDFLLVFTAYTNLNLLVTPGNSRILGHEDVFNLQVFPSFFAPFGSALDLVVAMVQILGQLMGYLVEFTIGIPRCEGPTLLAASTVLISTSLLILRWIVNDFFGIYAGAIESVKSCRPRCQAGFVTGVLFLGRGGIFVTMQGFVLLFKRSFSMANPSQVRWMCPHNDFSSEVFGRLIIAVSIIVGLTFFILAADGHLTGSNFLMGRMAEKLQLDLSDLDPDYDPKKMSLPKIHFSNWGSFLPTTFGLWFDNWNVKGYRIKERSVVYAFQFNDPQPCVECGEYHVPYREIIKATSKQVSLAWQAVPFLGMPIGKLCEYLNEPATYYDGEELVCFKNGAWSALVSKFTRRVSAEQNQINANNARFATFPPNVQRIVRLSRVAQAFGSHVLPWLQRLFAIFLAMLVILAPLSLRPENVTENARQIITAGMWISLAKGQLDYGLPSLVLAIMGSAVLAVDPPMAGESAVVPPSHKGIFITQALLGSLVGSFIAVCRVGDYVLQIWSYAMVVSTIVPVVSVCVAWHAMQSHNQAAQITQKLLVMGLCMLMMLLYSTQSTLTTEELAILFSLFMVAAMVVLMLCLSSAEEFPCQNMMEDPGSTKWQLFTAFFREVFLTRSVIIPYSSIVASLGVAMMIDQYVACADTLIPIETSGGVVLSEEEQAQTSSERYSGPYCFGPNDWSPFSRVLLHWFIAPLLALVFSLTTDALKANLPVVCSICLFILCNIITCSIFMVARISFTYYILALVFLCGVSLTVGIFLEWHVTEWVLRTYSFIEEEDLVLQPKARPWEADFSPNLTMCSETQYRRILRAEVALQNKKAWVDFEHEDHHAEVADKVGSLSPSVLHSVPHILKRKEQQKIEDAKRRHVVSVLTRPVLELEDDEDSPTHLTMLTLPGATFIEDIPVGSPTYSERVVQGAEVREADWHRPPAEWLNGIPPPRPPTLQYRAPR